MNDNFDTATRIVRECEYRGINLCGTFETWTKCAFALAELGEQGRELFHRLAMMDEKYRQRENDMKFSNALRTSNRTGFASLVYLAKEAGVNTSAPANEKPTAIWPRRSEPHRVVVHPADYIPTELIERSEGTRNHLCSYLSGVIGDEALHTAVRAYRIGSTRAGATIFPQLDEEGRCRTGKVILYDPKSGHRVKTAGADWLHTRYMKMQGKPGEAFNLRQSLFGQHLLRLRPNDAACIVEAEKTAFICSMLFPKCVWLAVGGQMMFTEERLLPLAGRKVVVYPDADAAQDWQRRAEAIPFAKTWVFSDWHKDEDEGSKRDIADLLLEHLAGHPQPKGKPTDNGRLSPEGLLAKWRAENEAFNRLCEHFKLEVVA